MAHNTTRSLEQRYKSGVAGLYARLKSNYDWICERFGDEEGVKIITDMSRRYGLQVAERLRKKVTGSDVKSVGGALIRIFESVGGEVKDEYVERSENKIVLKAPRCPLNFDKPGMCLAHTTMEKTVIEQLAPNLTYRIGKSIPAGDPYCEHIIEVKTPPQA